MSETEDSAPVLTFEESRVLGCLMEKEITTPDYYPLTLNSLTTACNQRSNRSPVVEWDDKIVESALESLRRKKVAVMMHLSGSRSPKYKHTIGEMFSQLTAASRAVLCELMIRGRQTFGELRTNCERMYSFPDLTRLEECIQSLADYPTGPMVIVLPPGAGRKVKTCAHLLCGPVEADAPAPSAAASQIIPPPPEWKAEMEAKIAELQTRLAELEAFVADLKS